MCPSLFLNKVLGRDLQLYLKRGPLVQVFFCELCEISKITFLQNTLEQLLMKLAVTSGTKYSRMDQVKFVDDSL